MERVGEHPSPPAARCAVARARAAGVRAGVAATARVEVENAGTAPWRSRGAEDVQLSYHWLDERGNPIVWDGLAHAARARRSSRARACELDVAIRAPIPPGRYRLAFDLVEEHASGSPSSATAPLERRCDVAADRAAPLAVRGADPARSRAGRALGEEDAVEAGTRRRRAGARLDAAHARRARGGLRGGRRLGRVEPARGAAGARAWAPGGGRHPRVPASARLPVARSPALEPNAEVRRPAGLAARGDEP